MIVLAPPAARPAAGVGEEGANHLAIAARAARRTAIADLVRHLLDTMHLNDIEVVSERSEGNPFYAGELVRAYLDHGSLERLPDTVQPRCWPARPPPADGRRILQLGQRFRAVVRAAGVVAWRRGWPGRHTTVREPRDRDLIRPADSDRFAFRHILSRRSRQHPPTIGAGPAPHRGGTLGRSRQRGREVAVARSLRSTTAKLQCCAQRWTLASSRPI